MKRKIAFALLFTSTIGGAWSCVTWGQDPVGPARGTRPKLYTTRLEDSKFAPAEVSVDYLYLNGNNNLDEHVTNLVKELKSATGAEKESILTQLKSTVGQQFDNRQEGKAKELKALEEQLAKLKEIHTMRTQQREQIVVDRVQQLLREVEGLGWGSESSDAVGIARFPGMRQPIGTFETTVRRPLGDLIVPASPPTPSAPPALPR